MNTETKKLLIVADMEGISGIGINDFWATIKGHPKYFLKRHLMVEDVNTAIKGAVEAGIKPERIIVADWHLTHHNIRERELPKGVTLIRDNENDVLERGIEKAFLIGFHARAGTPVKLAHTFQYAIKSFKIQGKEAGEGAMWAYNTGSLDIPVVLLSGDEYAVKEMKLLNPRCICITTKTQKIAFSSQLIHKELQEAAERAIISSIQPITSSTPFSVKFSFKSSRGAKHIPQEYYTRQENGYFVIEGKNAHEVYGDLRKFLLYRRNQLLGYKLISFFE